MPKRPPGDDNVGRMQFLLGLRKRGIGDPAVLRAMDEVPREHFVDSSFLDSAYADQALPIACGQTISQPYVVAYMSEQLQVRPAHRVLEVGTGSGYQAAILSRLAREVITIERYRTLAETARGRLAALGFTWKDTTASQLYTVHDIHHFLADEIVARGAAAAGLTWHYCRPPVVDLEYEMDCRGVALERVV